MKNTLIALCLFAVLPAGTALADDNDCMSSRDQWQSRDAAMQMADRNGWTVREFKADDGCYKIEGRDRDGRPIEVKLDPASLRVIKLDGEDRGLFPARGSSSDDTIAPQAQSN